MSFRLKLNHLGDWILIFTAIATVAEVVMFSLNRSHPTPYYLVAFYAIGVILAEMV